MDKHNDLIANKLEELIALSKAEGDNNTQIVLNALHASRGMDDDGLLAGHVQEYVKDVLLPRAEQRKERGIAAKN